MISAEPLPVTSWTMEEWDKPRPLPDRGVTIPTLSRREFEFYFMNIDSQIWEMTQAQRETWKNDILDDWDIYRRILYQNKTGVLHQQLRDMDRMGGGIILIPGEMGTGKSIIANTLLKIWNVLKKNTDPPHIFWSKNEVRAKIRKTAPNTAHSIDEDMRSTGRGAGNLEVHLKNVFETIRKTGKLVTDVGVNVESSRLARAVGLQIFPIGFNRWYQASRFIVCNWKGRPLWLATTQRFYYPDEPVLYEGELGYFGEYDARADAFSRTTTGVFGGSNAEQELEWRTQLVKHWNKDWKGITPSIDVLEFEAIQLGIPQESVATIRRICASARLILRKDKTPRPDRGSEIEVTGEGWEIFRNELAPIVKDNAHLAYFVPEIPLESYPDIVSRLHPVSRFGRPLLPDGLGKQIRTRRRLLDPKAIGDAGERAVVAWLDILGPVWGGGGEGVADVLVHHGGHEIAVNVKTTLKDSYKDQVASSPEHQWEHNAIVLLLPRLLEIRVFDIEGHKTTINSGKGGLATPGTLADMIITDIPKVMQEVKQ